MLFLCFTACEDQQKSDSAAGDDGESQNPDGDAVLGYQNPSGPNCLINDEIACLQPQDPPRRYFPFEAIWIFAVFDNPDLPVYALYSYFWIDWYYYQGCSYSSSLAGYFIKDGPFNENRIEGGLSSAYGIEYGTEGHYDVFVHPFLHFRFDPAWPTLYHFDIVGDGFSGRFDAFEQHTQFWGPQYYSHFDAEITDAVIEVDGRAYDTTGRATVERWFLLGGVDPSNPEQDYLQGYWIYEPFFWNDAEGRKVTTLLWYWVKKIGDQLVIHRADGVMSDGIKRFPVVDLTVDLDFPENVGADGYLIRHGFSGVLDNGTEFSYEATAKKEYRDRRPAAWEAFIPDEARRAHYYAEGVMEYDGRTFTGRGSWEWQVSTYNPLTDAKR